MSWEFYTPDSTPTMGISLPASPVDGQEFTLVDSMTAPTYSWLLRYVSAKATNKWIFIGGAPIHSEVVTAETTSSSAYAALTTAGPSIVLPVAGDYLVSLGAMMQNNVGNDGAFMSYDIGATGAVDADGIQIISGAYTASVSEVSSRVRKKTGLTAVTLTAKYKRTVGGTATFQDRWMTALPIAIGG